MNALVIAIEEWCLIAVQADVPSLVAGRNNIVHGRDLYLAINVAIEYNGLAHVSKDSVGI